MAVQRPDIINKINGNVCGDNWLSFTESPNAQIKSRKFINRRNESKSLTRYSTQWDFECLLDLSCPEIATVYDIGTEQKTGDDAVVEVSVIDTFRGNKTRTYDAIVQVNSINDDDDMIIKGTIYAISDDKEKENNS